MGPPVYPEKLCAIPIVSTLKRGKPSFWKASRFANLKRGGGGPQHGVQVLYGAS